MNLSRIVAELVPQLIARELERAREAKDADGVLFFETVAPELARAVTDGLCEFEITRESNAEARWVANCAAKMLMHHQGEPTQDEVDNAVRLAKRIQAQALKACGVK